MYICIYIYIQLYTIYIYIYTYVHIYIYRYISVYIYIYIFIVHIYSVYIHCISIVYIIYRHIIIPDSLGPRHQASGRRSGPGRGVPGIAQHDVELLLDLRRGGSAEEGLGGGEMAMNRLGGSLYPVGWVENLWKWW